MDSKNMIIQAGVSEEINSCYQMLRGCRTKSGEAKFSAGVCRNVVKTILCRTYAGPIYELCHLIHIASASFTNVKAGKAGRLGYVDFFYTSGRARASNFKGVINTHLNNLNWLGTKVKTHGQGVDISYPDGNFSVTFARMPFLSAFFSFLPDTVGYSDMSNVIKGMLVPGISKASVSASALKLESLLYKYLKDHLPTVQKMNKFYYLIGYMEKHHSPNFKPSDIDDEIILDFWIESGPADETSIGHDFKTYEGVFKEFLRLRHTLKQSADLSAIDGVFSIGNDHENGEVNLDNKNVRSIGNVPEDGKVDFNVLAIVEMADEYRDPLLALLEAPADAIKFLNNKERNDLKLLMKCGMGAFDLSLSLMRCEVFARGQGRITQALRRKADAAELRNVINDCALLTYEKRKDEFLHSSLHIDKMLLASFYVLLRAKNEEAISLLTKLRPNLDLTHFAKLLGIDDQTADNVIMFDSKSISERFMDMIINEEKVGPDIVSLVTEARKAFGDVSRQGFSSNGLDDGAIINGFASGAMALLDIRDHLAGFCRTLESASSWNARFDADKDIFSRQFTMLYGGN